MKKITALLLALIVIILPACSNNKSTTTVPHKTEDNTMIRIGGLTGPTSIGLIKVMDEAEEKNYEFTVCGTADELNPLLIQGKLDAAAIPVNLASVLFNKTEGKIKIAAVNTLGVLYIVTKGETVQSVSDLKGKTVYCTGKGQTPEYNLRYILTQNGLDPDKDVTLEFKSEPAEVVGVLNTLDSGIAMLPQPYVTVASGKVEGLSVALDLTAEWKKVNKDSEMVTGVLVVREEFANEHPEAVERLLSDYEKSVAFVNQNVAEAAELVGKYEIFQAAVAEKAIPKCNIVFIKGDAMKPIVSSYLEVLFSYNPQSVGGKLPGNELFYEK